MGEKLHLNRITMDNAPSSRIILISHLINTNLLWVCSLSIFSKRYFNN